MIEKRVAVVTGANRGIGFETARQLARAGLHVVVAARAPEQASAAARRITSDGGSATPQALDVTQPASVLALAHVLEHELGRVDVLVNNAGVALDKWLPVLQLDVDVMRATMETNVYGALRCCQAMVPLMRRRSYGRIVNVSSQLGSLTRMSGMTYAYRASKAALNALTRTLAAELAQTNILVNSICPGWVKTPLGGEDAPRLPAEAAAQIVKLALSADDGPRGGFFQDGEPLPW